MNPGSNGNPFSAPYTEDLSNQYANSCSRLLLFTEKYHVSSKTGSNMHRLKPLRMPYVYKYSTVKFNQNTRKCSFCKTNKILSLHLEKFIYQVLKNSQWFCISILQFV